MKKIIVAALVCAGFVLVVNHFLLQSRPSVASASTAPDLSITATPSSGLSNSFYLGQSYVLSLTGAPANATFTLCAVFPSGTHSCTPNWGTTDASGNWSSPSTQWTAATTATGTWEEGIQFPAQNPPVYSNGINFTMAASAPGTAPTPPVTPVAPVAPVAPVTPPTTQPVTPTGSLPAGTISCGTHVITCPFSANADPISPANGDHTNSNWFEQGVQELFGLPGSQSVVPQNNLYYATSDGANLLAQCLNTSGYNVTAGSIMPTGKFESFNDSESTIGFPNGGTVSAGALIGAYEAAAQCVGTASGCGGIWTNFCTAISPAPGVGYGPGIPTNWTIATPPTSAPNTNQSISSINSILNSAAAGYTQALQATSNQAENLPSPAALSSPVAASAGGSCASAASATITSSLQTLQSLAGVLATANISQGVLTSVQNLINAVAQVLTALSNCIDGQATAPVGVPPALAVTPLSVSIPAGGSGIALSSEDASVTLMDTEPNSVLQWQATSSDWCSASPSSGTLAGGTSAVVMIEPMNMGATGLNSTPGSGLPCALTFSDNGSIPAAQGSPQVVSVTWPIAAQ